MDENKINELVGEFDIRLQALRNAKLEDLEGCVLDLEGLQARFFCEL